MSAPLPPAADDGTKRDFPNEYGEKSGNAFSACSGGPPIEVAAIWLFEHREECIGRCIAVLKTRFGLKNLDAIEAAKRAHDLQYGGRAS